MPSPTCEQWTTRATPIPTLRCLDVRVQGAPCPVRFVYLIHADAFIRADANGSSVFALSESGACPVRRRVIWRKGNAADLIGVILTSRIGCWRARCSICRKQPRSVTVELGKSVLGELSGINRLHKASVEQAGFAVLKVPAHPVDSGRDRLYL